MKEEHRDDIASLLAERDALKQEVEELKQTRGALREEASALNAKNAELSDLNNQASRQLEAARDAFQRLHQQASSLGMKPEGLAKFGPLPPFPSSAHQTNSSISSTASPAPSSLDAPDQSPFAVQKVEHVTPAPQAPVVRKFKWPGKAKNEKTLAPNGGPGHQAASSMSKPQQAHSLRANGSSEMTHRQHLLHAVSILRPVRCEHCGDKMWGLQELRCASECRGPSRLPPTFFLLLPNVQGCSLTICIHSLRDLLSLEVLSLPRHGVLGDFDSTSG